VLTISFPSRFSQPSLSFLPRFIDSFNGPDSTYLALSSGEAQHLTQALHTDQLSPMFGLPTLY